MWLDEQSTQLQRGPEVSINSPLEEPTGLTEKRCVNSESQSNAPGGLIAGALAMPVDKEKEANLLNDQIFDLQKFVDALTSQMDGAWNMINKKHFAFVCTYIKVLNVMIKKNWV